MRPLPRLLAALALGALISQSIAYTACYRATNSYLGDHPLPPDQLRLPSFLKGKLTEPTEGSWEAGRGPAHTAVTLRCPDPDAPTQYRDNPAQYGLYIDSWGWPARSLISYRCGLLMSGGNGNHLDTYKALARVDDLLGPRRGLEVPRWFPLPRASGSPRVPTWPLLPGLALNTLLYATPLALLFLAPAPLRRAHRRRQGHCPHCNYDLQGLTPCPECGR